jgi:hypothetical protein
MLGNPGMRLAVDTNRYTDLCRGIPSVIETIELADEVWLPVYANRRNAA